MATITVMDPVTRIEGHMKVEVTIDGAPGKLKVVDARCTGTLFRGFESILAGRVPWDAPIITERICGVCPVSHGMASVMALDAAANKLPTTNGRILRNLVLGANFIQSHILHFYLLAAFDYVTPPDSAPWNSAWDVDLGRGGLTLHLQEALEARRVAHEMGAIFGGRMPSPHTYIPGGFTNVPTAEKIFRFREKLYKLRNFVANDYLPDVKSIAGEYGDYFSIGKGCANLLAFGVFDLNDSGTTKLLRRGRVAASTPGRVESVDTNRITESVTWSWYEDATNDLVPANGLTKPLYPKGAAYSWLKAPRYSSTPYEAGPLARMWVNGDYRRGVSVMDRHLARAQEALKVAEAMDKWLDQLDPGAPAFNTAGGLKFPSKGSGIGLTEAPRGALGHWVNITGGKITNYQVITPTCWNASPKDAKGERGPMEQALIGTPVTDPDRPIEALRVIHSFDPCLSCAVHVMRPKGRPVVVRTGPR